MSKLYDQLRDAVRSRRELLAQNPQSNPGEARVPLAQLALQREAELRAGRQTQAAAEKESARAITETRAATGRGDSGTSPRLRLLGGAAAAMVLVASGFIAGQLTSRNDPPRSVPQAEGLRLDRSLDLSRRDASGRSSLPGPARSR